MKASDVKIGDRIWVGDTLVEVEKVLEMHDVTPHAICFNGIEVGDEEERYLGTRRFSQDDDIYTDKEQEKEYEQI